MKKKNRKPRFLALRPGAILYLILFPVCLVFTQALRSPASAILFVFLMFLPIISLLYIIIARAGIKVYTDSDSTRAEKGDTVGYEIKIINETPLPFPFVETIVSLPEENAIVCRDNLMRITLLPMGCHIINSRVSFPLRGSYDIGVKYLYISDLFGLFRTEMKLELHRTVVVYPRNIVMSADTNRSDTDLPTSVTRKSSSPEQAEPADIRDYVPGDSMKNIHWKLSSKSEELQVKNYASNTDRHTYILCDLSFAGAEKHDSAASPLVKDEPKKKKRGRRGKTAQSAGVASAKSVGDAGGESTSANTGERSTAEKLEALGITPEHLAAIGNLDAMGEMTLEESATRKGAKNARRATAERMARLAVSVSDSLDVSAEKGKISPFNEEYLPHAGELCADSVIELALSAMRYEASRGVQCTVLYPDSRSDNGIGVLSSANDVHEDPALMKFFTAPVCRQSDAFADLAMMISQSAGMTIRMVTANTDIHSAAVFAALPAAFGGAGSGCTAEVLLAEPKDLWTNEAERSVNSQAMGEELSRSGVALRQFMTESGVDGRLRFTSGM